MAHGLHGQRHRSTIKSEWPYDALGASLAALMAAMDNLYPIGGWWQRALAAGWLADLLGLEAGLRCGIEVAGAALEV